MDKIGKALARLTQKEKKWIKEILKQLEKGDTRNLDIKKFKGRDDIFRVRKGDIRLMYRKDHVGAILLLTIDRRNESTYR